MFFIDLSFEEVCKLLPEFKIFVGVYKCDDQLASSANTEIILKLRYMNTRESHNFLEYKI